MLKSCMKMMFTVLRFFKRSNKIDRLRKPFTVITIRCFLEESGICLRQSFFEMHHAKTDCYKRLFNYRFPQLMGHL